MKRNKLTAEQMFKKIMENTDDFLNDVEADEIEEINTSGAVAGYSTPNAFAPADEDEDQTIARALKQTGSGFTPAKNQHKNTFKMWEMKSLGESTYRQFKKDESMSAHQKVNTSIHQMNSKLFEIEKIVRQNVRLKNESGIGSEQYWKSTQNKLQKIKERVVKLAVEIEKFGE